MPARTRSPFSKTPGHPANGRLLGMQSLLRNRLYDGEGHCVGKLEEIILDVRTGCVRHVVIAVGGIMGVGRKRLAVPWSALSPDSEYRRCVVDVAHIQFTAVRVPPDDPWLQRIDSVSTGAALLSRVRAAGTAD
jgi:sporulation protein YlmC with PRC-barrel domain